MPIILPAQDSVVTNWGMTLRGLVRELASRMGELALAQPDSLGTSTTMIEPGLNQFWPADIAQSNVYVYGAENVVPANSGFERRARSWAAATSTLTLHPPGFPAAIDARGVYEIHTRSPRERKVRALNEAVGQLFLSWYREFIDETLVTVNNQWRYVLPGSENWSAVPKIEIQASTNTQLVGYPFINAARYNCRTYRDVDANGVTVWYLQFGTMPPPGRTIRLYGEGYTPDLVNDTDTLALDGKWKNAALAWIYDYGEYRLMQWEGNRQPAGQADRYRIMSLDRLNAAKERLLKQAPAPRPRAIIVPGHGDAEAHPPYSGAEWLGAFANTH